jgi:two-component system LytT family response regulator
MSERLRVAVVDDEPLARDLIREFLSHHPNVEIVAECANGFDAVREIEKVKPDLVFLDIQMPKLTGFEVLELLNEPVPVIFVTAYEEFAIRAFEVHAVDYLLKPVSQERLDEALKHAAERLRIGHAPDYHALVRDAQSKQGWLERVLIREGTNVHVLPVASIDYAEAQDDYVCFHAAGTTHLKTMRLNELADRLDPGKFVRIHRSFVLNLDRLARIELYAKDSRIVILKNGDRLPVSRAGYDRLKLLL